jgi:hypothetical protein
MEDDDMEDDDMEDDDMGGEYEIPGPGEDPAVIKGFEPGGTDKLELPDGVKYDDLEFVRKGKNTQVKMGKERLATINGVRPNQLSMDDFEMNEGPMGGEMFELSKKGKALVVKEFDPEMDMFKLPDGVGYDDLNLVRKGKNTQIKLGRKTIGVVRGASPDDLGMDAFGMDDGMEPMKGEMFELPEKGKALVVKEFDPEMDMFKLPEGVGYDDLNFVGKGKNTQIKLGKKTIGVVRGTSPDDLGMDVFGMDDGMEDMNIEEKLKGAKLYTKGFKKGKTGVGRMGTDLLIDGNQDGMFDEEEDPMVEGFFKKNKGKQKGEGFINGLGNLKGNQLLGARELPDKLINGGGMMEEGEMEPILLPEPGPGMKTIRKFEPGNMFMLPEDVMFEDLEITNNAKGTWTYIGADGDRLAKIKGTPELMEEDFVPFSEDMMV